MIKHLGCAMHRLLYIAILFFSSCSYSRLPPPSPQKFVDSSEVTWVVEKIAVKWSHECGRRLRLEHSQICYFNESPTLRLELSSQEILEVKEARYLLVDFVEDLLRELNTNPIIVDGLTYPLQPEQLRIDINFESFFGVYIDPFYIGYVQLKEGYARYYAFDQKDRERYSWHSRVEPYTKSRELAMMERAAEAQFEAEHDCIEAPLEGLFDLDLQGNDRCLYKRKF